MKTIAPPWFVLVLLFSLGGVLIAILLQEETGPAERGANKEGSKPFQTPVSSVDDVSIPLTEPAFDFDGENDQIEPTTWRARVLHSPSGAPVRSGVLKIDASIEAADITASVASGMCEFRMPPGWDPVVSGKEAFEFVSTPAGVNVAVSEVDFVSRENGRTIVVHIPDFLSLVAQVSFKTGEPIEGAKVEAWAEWSKGAIATGMTDEEGLTSLEFPPGVSAKWLSATGEGLFPDVVSGFAGPNLQSGDRIALFPKLIACVALVRDQRDWRGFWLDWPSDISWAMGRPNLPRAHSRISSAEGLSATEYLILQYGVMESPPKEERTASVNFYSTGNAPRKISTPVRVTFPRYEMAEPIRAGFVVNGDWNSRRIAIQFADSGDVCDSSPELIGFYAEEVTSDGLPGMRSFVVARKIQGWEYRLWLPQGSWKLVAANNPVTSRWIAYPPIEPLTLGELGSHPLGAAIALPLKPNATYRRVKTPGTVMDPHWMTIRVVPEGKDKISYRHGFLGAADTFLSPGAYSGSSVFPSNEVWRSWDFIVP
jgi:hypothetical protein